MGDNSTDDANEKGSRNKRKFFSENPLETPDDLPVLSLSEFTRYELLEEKLQRALNKLGSLEDIFTLPKEKQGVERKPSDDWEDPITCQLEEFLSQNLSASFQSAIKRIVDSGYSQEIAEWVLLKNGLYHGPKDTVSNIVDGALDLLSREKDFDTSRHRVFTNLQSLVNYTILEMISVLQEVKPVLTVAEAMWCLLICDLDLIYACTVEGDLLVESSSQSLGDGSSTLKHSKSMTEASEVTRPTLDKSHLSKPSTHIAQTLQSKVPISRAALEEPNFRNSHLQQPLITGKGSSVPLPEGGARSSGASMEHYQTPLKAAVVEDKSGAGRKESSLSSRKEFLRQKTFHFEKNYRGRMGKGAIKAKLSAWGNMVMEKSLMSQAISSGAATKSSHSKVNVSVKSNSPIPEGSSGRSFPSSSITPATDTSGEPPVQDSLSPSPAVNKNAPAARALEPKPSVEAPGSTTSSEEVPDYYAGIPYDESLGKYIPQNERDAAILLLTTHMKTQQKELQRWSDWANEKVMQAARRLGKDQPELKMLRQEKDEAEKFQKETQVLEESATKRLSEMEYALTNTGGQIGMANSTLSRLEGENAVLKREMEAAERSARGSATNLVKALALEQEALKKCQAGEVEKRLLHEEFSTLKHETGDLQQQQERAKKRRDQFEVLWKQEEREKQRILQQAASLKAEKKQVVAQGKVEQANVREKAESSMKKCKEDVEKLENEISQLRFQAESSKIEALKRGLQRSPDNFGSASVKMERECVMCMAEEMSVVFLPCAHQVLCAKCNVLHERQGMNECPSCRTPITERINARFAES